MPVPAAVKTNLEALTEIRDNAVHYINASPLLSKYPWDAADLKQKLKNRYIDFTENPKYHALKKKFAANPQYMNTRYLDSGNPKSSRKDFYNPNILHEFDKNYTLKNKPVIH